MLLEAPVEYRLSVAQNKANSRNNQLKTEEGRRKVFLEAIKYGPIFGCVSCHKLCYDNFVVSLPDNLNVILKNVTQEYLIRLLEVSNMSNLLKECIIFA